MLFRGGFWRADQRLSPSPEVLENWPTVTAVIPARNEAETIAITVASLLEQSYPGELNVIVVDDNSDDGTADVARKASTPAQRLCVISGKPIIAGWSGKLWAVSQGITYARENFPETDYLLLTDADINHHPDNLTELVCKAEHEVLGLVSLMVKLRCQSFWEKLLIPAFVFFFQKLYPFPQVNNPLHSVAAAAGGCMLVRDSVLRDAGGVEAIRERLIDDCALATLIKKHQPIWLGLSERTSSLRAYDNLSDIWNMVARTAFVQLNHSVFQLLGAVVGMIILYLTPAVALGVGVISGSEDLVVTGGATMILMGLAYGPTLKLYEFGLDRAVMLPFAGVLFTLMTISSAIRHWKGRGGAWKGRSYPTG